MIAHPIAPWCKRPCQPRDRGPRHSQNHITSLAFLQKTRLNWRRLYFIQRLLVLNNCNAPCGSRRAWLKVGFGPHLPHAIYIRQGRGLFATWRHERIRGNCCSCGCWTGLDNRMYRSVCVLSSKEEKEANASGRSQSAGGGFAATTTNIWIEESLNITSMHEHNVWLLQDLACTTIM